MPNSITGTVQGLNDLTRKVNLMRLGFNTPELNKLLMRAGVPIRDQARRNARRGPTGMTAKRIYVFTGKKAGAFQSEVVVKAQWKGTGAVFEEWGTKERKPPFGRSKNPNIVMRAPAGKFGMLVSKGSGVGVSGRAFIANRWGYVFFRSAKAMTGTRFFENAVEQKMPETAAIIEVGCNAIIARSIL